MPDLALGLIACAVTRRECGLSGGGWLFCQ